MSDTHSLTSHINTPIPDGDVFVHAGDFTRAGHPTEVREFNNWIGKVSQTARHKKTEPRTILTFTISSSHINTRSLSPATMSCVSILLSQTTQTGRVARDTSGAVRRTSTSSWSMGRTHSPQAPSTAMISSRSSLTAPTSRTLL